MGKVVATVDVAMFHVGGVGFLARQWRNAGFASAGAWHLA